MTGLRQRAVLLLTGAFVVLTAATGQHARYVRPGMRYVLLGTGAVTVFLAVHGALREWRRRDLAAVTHGPRDHHDGDHDDQDGPHDDPDHDHAGTAWLMVAPVVCFALLAPPALGSYSAERATDAAVASRSPDSPAWRALPAGDVVPLRLGEFITRARWDESGTLTGRTVRLTGFVTPGRAGGPTRTGSPQRWDVARMAIMCCAADAAVYRVRLGLGVPASSGPSLPDVDTWVEVEGRWVPGPGDSPANTEPPRLLVSAVRRIEPPANPYEKQ